MSLCSLCLAVPWSSLPPPRKFELGCKTADEDDMLAFGFRLPEGHESPDNQALQQPLGLPFHENLETLAQSAKSCPLCAVVQSGVQVWINSWEDAAKNYKQFIVLRMDSEPIPVKEQLRITKRLGAVQGFIVWAKNPKEQNMYYLLTAVGFSVDSGMALSIFRGLICLWSQINHRQKTHYRNNSQCGHWR